LTHTPPRPRRVVQISDSHLFASTDGRLLGLNTENSLKLVLDRVALEQPAIDVILATGDISQDGSLIAYQRFHQHLQRFKAPSYWLQGNHDITAPMLDTLNGNSHISPCVVEQGKWRIIMLNSSVEHQVPGHFRPEELAYLRQALIDTKEFHALVCLHHHPLPMGCAWLDTQVVRNAEAFWVEIDKASHVRGIAWGHVHQEWEQDRKGVKLFSVPSTCVQFKPLSKDFAVDERSPGYRWFDLHDDGRIDSTVSRVEGVKFEVDLSVKGY
jgi:Icc protein